jgi:hypothetical protein
MSDERRPIPLDSDGRPVWNELARRLAAAYISYTVGLSVAHTLKKYIDEDPGPFWQQLAVDVTAELTKAMDDRMNAEREQHARTMGPIQ